MKRLGLATLVSILGGCLFLSSTTRATTVSLPQSETKDTQLLLAKAEFMKNAKQASYEAYFAEKEQQTGQSIKEDDNLRDLLLEEQRKKAVESAAENKEIVNTEDVTDVSDEQESSIVKNTNEFVSVAPVFEETIPALLDAWVVDSEYKGSVIELDSTNRYYLERLVMGEAGNQGFIGAALVAQTIHDTMIMDNNYDLLAIKKEHGYTGSLDKAPNQDVLDAVSFIFDDGGMAVQHRLVYFYAPKLVRSNFHESQLFIVEYGGHRFFDER